MSKRDGGPAFPAPEFFESAIEGETGKFMYDHPGMTLRDWYKGQALKGTDWRFMLEHSGDPRSTLARIAEECGMMADAMLAVREEKS